MSAVAEFLDFTSKLIFGLHISLAFAGVTYKSNRREYSGIFLMLVLLQTIIYLVIGQGFMVSIYPLVIHIPIILFLRFKMDVSWVLSIVSLFFAFQFLSPRQWLGVTCGSLIGKDPIVTSLATILLSIPLAWVICRYLAPEVAAFKGEDNRVVLIAGLAPMFYYVMTYATVIYSDLLTLNGERLVQLVDGSFTIVFLIYTVFLIKIMQEKKETETEREVLLVMKEASRAELDQLHKQQGSMLEYRHDLRHHISYLDGVLAEGGLVEARKYLQTILKDQDNQVIYASDESVRMIVAQFTEIGERENVTMDVRVNTDDFSGFDQLNLCSLLSNGLENAIKFSKRHKNPMVYLEMHRSQRNLSIVIKNNYSNLPEFRNLRPFTKEHGHGYGTKSMEETVKKYNGFSQFYSENECFIFRATLIAKVNWD